MIIMALRATYQLIPWSRVPKVTYLVKKFPAFYAILSVHKSPSQGLFPELDESIPHSHLIWFTSTFVLSSSLHLDLPDGLFSSDFSTKHLYALLSCTSHHWPSKGYLERSINHEAPHYGTFFSTSCYSLSLRSKYSAHCAVLECPQLVTWMLQMCLCMP
jgi:hypothetical protein